MPYAFHGRRIIFNNWLHWIKDSNLQQDLENEIGKSEDSDPKDWSKKAYKSKLYSDFVNSRIAQGELASSEIGNMYTASIFMSLLSFLSDNYRNNKDIAKKIDKSVFPGLQGGPHMNNVAGKAVAFGEALTDNFRSYSAQVIKNAQAMAEVFIDEGITIVNGGTDNHLLLVDVTKGFADDINGGKVAQTQLDEIGITLNMNVIPNDPKSALDPSGIRFGTPAITTRGMGEDECREIASIMIGYLRDTTDTHRKSAKNRISELAKRFPVPRSFV